MRAMLKKSVVMDAETVYYKKRVLELIKERLAIERTKNRKSEKSLVGLRKQSANRTKSTRSVSGSG